MDKNNYFDKIKKTKITLEEYFNNFYNSFVSLSSVLTHFLNRVGFCK